MQVGAAATLGVSPADIKAISAPPTTAVHLLRSARRPILPTPEWRLPYCDADPSDRNLARVTPVASSSVIVQTEVDHR
jgi:hypothetical protein